MIDTALYFLYRVASRVIPQNRFAKAVYNRFKNAGSNVDVDSLELLAIPFKEVDSLGDNDPIKIEKNKDYRFLYLYLKSFRKFPSCSEDVFYGVPFCRKNENGALVPESTLLQGGNGTGKTSIFGAMEFLFTGKMSTAEKQGFRHNEELEDFIPSLQGNIAEMKINVATCSLLFTSQSGIRQQNDFVRLCLLPFFCSEYDVDKVVAEGVNGFIYEQIGYTYVRKIIQKIEKEMLSAAKQYEQLESSIDLVKTHAEELDKLIGIYDNLRPSFLLLVTRLSSEQNPKKKLNVLRALLSLSFIIETEPDISSKTMVLSLDSLNKEIRVLEKALGKKAEAHLIMQQYSRVKECLRSEQEKQDLLMALPKNKKENIIEEVGVLNNYRECFSKIVDMLLDSEELSDVAFYVEKYEGLLQSYKKERSRIMRQVEEAVKIESVMANMDVYEEFLTALKAEVFGTINNITKGARDLLNSVMGLFAMDDENMSLDFDEKNGLFRMNITIQTENGNSVTCSPERYFNTFRYKLFCMTLKMAVAFSVKQFYKINFPIVI